MIARRASTYSFCLGIGASYVNFNIISSNEGSKINPKTMKDPLLTALISELQTHQPKIDSPFLHCEHPPRHIGKIVYLKPLSYYDILKKYADKYKLNVEGF